MWRRLGFGECGVGEVCVCVNFRRVRARNGVGGQRGGRSSRADWSWEEVDGGRGRRAKDRGRCVFWGEAGGVGKQQGTGESVWIEILGFRVGLGKCVFVFIIGF